MKTLVKGIDIQLIARWIAAMEKDINKNAFYCEECHNSDYLFVTSLNKARLLIMYDIFHISNNDNRGGSDSDICTYKKSIKKANEKMLAYFETMKELLEIKTPKKKKLGNI